MQVDLIQSIEKMLSAHGVQVTRITPPFAGLENFDYGLRKALDPVFDWQAFGQSMLDNTPRSTLVLTEGVFELHFAMFRLPDEENVVYCIGPWTSAPRSEKSLEWCRKNLGKAGNEAVEEYFNAIRRFPDNELVTSLYALLTLVFPATEFETAEWHEFMPLNYTPDTRFFTEPGFEQEMPASLVEQRYANENRLMAAVARGDAAAAINEMEKFSRFKISARFSDPLRDRKNLLVIFNTLLRKSIETASVHPWYIDKVSRKYALRIENMTDDAERSQLLRDMVREYCTYVQRYSLRNYSPLVQRVINHINLNLQTALSLKSLSAMCFISPSYLSNIFKQETGQTLTDYINTQRMKRAELLLGRSEEPIAQVAEKVGILDVNYFTKMFKKTTGVTPTQYRRDHRER